MACDRALRSQMARAASLARPLTPLRLALPPCRMPDGHSTRTHVGSRTLANTWNTRSWPAPPPVWPPTDSSPRAQAAERSRARTPYGPHSRAGFADATAQPRHAASCCRSSPLLRHDHSEPAPLSASEVGMTVLIEIGQQQRTRRCERRATGWRRPIERLRRHIPPVTASVAKHSWAVGRPGEQVEQAIAVVVNRAGKRPPFALPPVPVRSKIGRGHRSSRTPRRSGRRRRDPATHPCSDRRPSPR